MYFIEILMILTKYVFDVSVRLTEYSVTVGSVTLMFYCRGRSRGGVSGVATPQWIFQLINTFI